MKVGSKWWVWMMGVPLLADRGALWLPGAGCQAGLTRPWRQHTVWGRRPHVHTADQHSFWASHRLQPPTVVVWRQVEALVFRAGMAGGVSPVSGHLGQCGQRPQCSQPPLGAVFVMTQTQAGSSIPALIIPPCHTPPTTAMHNTG